MMTQNQKKMFRNCNRSVFGVLFFAMFFLGCAANNQQAFDISFSNDEISRLNEQILSRAQMQSDASEYLLGAGDLLEVSVFEAEELNTKVRVSSRGFITVPLLGQVLIKGSSAREAEQQIEDLYRKQYIKDPHVSIFVAEHYSQRVTLVGQFKNPGTYDYLSKQRLLDVIALGGGLSDKAGRIAQVRRSSNLQGEPGIFIIDLDRLIKEGQDEFNIEINGGDVLFVPEAGVFFIGGAVRKPGAYSIKHKTIMQEALLEAGGLLPYGSKDNIQLVRSTESGEKKVIVLDLKEQHVRELELKDRDIIIVDASSFGKFFHGFWTQIGIPGANIGYRDPELRY
jgi:polysaccharide export outer membrane protein